MVSSLISPFLNCAATLPLRMTIIRSLMAISSGMSEEIITIDLFSSRSPTMIL